MEVRQIAGNRVLFAMAANAEYGEHLRQRFVPLITGVGPVEAGIHLAAALARLEREGMLPDFVVSLGSAGSARLRQGEVFQVASVSYRDMDASALGFERGKTPFLDLPAVVPMPVKIPAIAEASLSTGANIVSGAAYETIAEDMVDMESFAVLRACMLFGVAAIGLRGISDGARELVQLSDWTEYLHVVDENLAIAVDRFEEALAIGTLAWKGRQPD